MIRNLLILTFVIGASLGCENWIYKPSWKCALGKPYRVEMQVCDEDQIFNDCQTSTHCISADGGVCRGVAKGLSCGWETDGVYESYLWVRHTCQDNGALTDWIKSEEDKVLQGQVDKGEPLITFSRKYELSTLKNGFSKI